MGGVECARGRMYHSYGQKSRKKTEEDLKCLLTTEWDRKFQGNLNIMVYAIHLVKELLEAIQKVELVESSQAMFLTFENGLSLMNLIPWLWEVWYAWIHNKN